MKVLDAAAMREVDRRAIEELGIPSLVLMENAASGVADALAASYPESGRVAIFCGPGNNGGDGLALARILSNRGWEVTTVVVHGGKELSGDAGTQRSIVAAMGLPVLEVAGEEDLERSLRTVRAHEVVVDALFGTGLDRPLEDLFGRTVDALDGLGIPLVAVDIPSGLDASRSERIGPSTHADLTVTFAAPKRAHLFAPAADAVGRVVVVDLGIPDELVQEAEGVELLEGADLSSLLPSRRAHTHKGSYGHLLVVAGSRGTLGAAILASRAAVRAGAGLVTLGVSRELVPFADIASIESMTLGYDAVAGGRIARAGIDVVLEACRERDALAMGPGMGTRGETGDAIREIALRAPRPVVLDADAVNAFAGSASDLAGRSHPTVLTPHPGELARLMEAEVPRTPEERLEAVRGAAAVTECVIVLKGHQTLIADPDGRLALNPTGNPGMATGGTGDVLTGMIGAYLARGIQAFEAACLGAFLHGRAGDLAAEEIGEESLAAGDLLDSLPETLFDF